MEHVVFSASVDGVGEEFRRVSSLEEAVRVVEHLRNDLGAADAAVFSLTPVPLAFRTYYRVEVSGVTDVSGASVASPTAPVVERVAEEAAHDGAAHDEPTAASELIAHELAVYTPDNAPDFESAGSEVPQLAELPATLAPGLEPREAESEHSLGYFTR
jgi:hypothetical protein